MRYTITFILAAQYQLILAITPILTVRDLTIYTITFILAVQDQVIWAITLI